MDNRINEIRCQISALRAEMLRVEDAMRDQIRHDQDSTEFALQLMAMRTQVAALVASWKAAGGSEPLPTLRERLKPNNRPAKAAKTVTPR